MVASWAILCGQIRNSAVAIKVIDVLEKWRSEGLLDGVSVSTWHGEFEKHPDVADRLRATDFCVIEAPQPRLRTGGHAIHQSRAVEIALDAVPDGARVLKLRPDLFEPGAAVRAALIKGPIPCDHSDGSPRVFEAKVAITGAFLGSAWYINDIMLLGMKADIKSIFHMDYGMYLRCRNLAPEQFFFARDFLKLPAASRYFEYNPGLVFGKPDASYKRMCAQLAFSDIVDAIWAYHETLRRYFDLSLHPGGEGDISQLRRYRLSELLAKDCGLSALQLHPGAFLNTAYSADVLDVLLDGRFAADAHSELYLSAPDRIGRDLLGRVSSPPEEASAFLARIREVEEYGPNWIDRSARIHRMNYDIDRPALIGEGDAYAAMEAELNRARRAIDLLNVEISAYRAAVPSMSPSTDSTS